MKNDSARGWLLVFVQVIIFIVFALLPTREVTAGSAVTGGLLIVVGAVFIAWAFISLGNALTANPVPLSHAELRTQRAFSVVRHPIYTGVLTALLGFVVLMGSWWTLAWWLVAVAFFWGKSRWEDSLLAAKHGDAWIRWSYQTPALLPFIHFRKKSAP